MRELKFIIWYKIQKRMYIICGLGSRFITEGEKNKIIKTLVIDGKYSTNKCLHSLDVKEISMEVLRLLVYNFKLPKSA
jgi:protein associated with RNAse G/E